MNILVHYFAGHMLGSLSGKYLIVGLLGHRLGVYLVLVDAIFLKLKQPFLMLFVTSNCPLGGIFPFVHWNRVLTGHGNIQLKTRFFSLPCS